MPPLSVDRAPLLHTAKQTALPTYGLATEARIQEGKAQKLNKFELEAKACWARCFPAGLQPAMLGTAMAHYLSPAALLKMLTKVSMVNKQIMA